MDNNKNMKKEIGKSILSRIDSLLHEKNLTRAELERRVDIGNGTLRNWNSSLPSIDKVAKVANFLGVSIDYIVNGEDNEKIKMLARDINSLEFSTQIIIKSIVDSHKKK